MTAPTRLLRIGSRGSPLALRQANIFAAIVEKASNGEIACEITTFTTTGDKIQDKPLQDAGGKGLFTKELDNAQAEGLIDVAVHSMKDMTAHIQPGLVLGAYMTREDPRDALLGPSPTISGLPHGAVLGTSSLRRKAQALAIRPDLHVVQFRGNVETRLRKLAEGVADATLLAAAGLNRLGLIDRAAGIVSVDEMLPAGGQGIVGVTIRDDAADWIRKAAAAADDPASRLAGVAERAFLRRLDGSCRTPIAAHFRLQGEGCWMSGEVLSDDGQQRWRASFEIDKRPSETEAEFLGQKLGDEVAKQREKDLGPQNPGEA